MFYDDSSEEPVLSERAAAAIGHADTSPDRRVQFSVGKYDVKWLLAFDPESVRLVEIRIDADRAR